MIIKGKLVDIQGTSPAKKYRIDTSTVRNDTYPAGMARSSSSSHTRR